MYAKNTITKRRPSGWAERRRQFRSYFLQVRAKATEAEQIPKAAPVIEIDKD